MEPRLNGTNYNITAHCPDCQAVTSFDYRNLSAIDNAHEFREIEHTRVLWLFNQCTRCGHGGLVKIHNRGTPQTAVLERFYPFRVENASIPQDVPADIQAEFREAELCASVGALRAASALLRSTLEKTLRANGYTKGNDPTLKDLQKRIDAAAADGIITDVRRKKAHEDIRALGNDVLHEDWREVAQSEFETAHHYIQRILEDFYDDRPTTEATLKAKSRIP